jgi:hypothetical protein
MSEFKFEYELNTVSRGTAALDNEEQRLRDELDHAWNAFRAQLLRVSAGFVICYVALFLTLLIVLRLSGPVQYSPSIAALSYLPVGAAISIARRRGGLYRLITLARDVMCAKRNLADWDGIKQEVNSLKQGFQGVLDTPGARESLSEQRPWPRGPG